MKTQKLIRNYELEITNDNCSLLRRNFWERQHLAGIYFNVAQASCLCLFLLKPQARRLYHTFLMRNIGYMIRFAKKYPLLSILQQPVAKSQTGTTSIIVPQPVAQLPSNQNELSPILPQLAAKLKEIEKISQLLPKGSVPHAEPPVGLFSDIKSSKLSKLRIS